MSTVTAQQTGVSRGNWKVGVAGGALGALVMGVLVILMNEATLAVAIPSLYMLAPPPNPALGMFVHVSHGAVLGVAFAALVGALDVRGTSRIVGVGVAWGVATWVVLAALLMPLWLSAVGSPADPPFPNFAIPSLLWHAVYGAVLGGVYAAFGESV
jgi:hypothetical protein